MARADADDWIFLLNFTDYFRTHKYNKPESEQKDYTLRYAVRDAACG
jgi:hypothetical protein